MAALKRTPTGDLRPALVVIVGPTAAGKTGLAVDLAPHFNGEIVSADSRQIYTGLDIGTAKPTAAQQAQVPHHLVDVVPPERALSLGEYKALAYAAIDDIQRRGRLPFLVGGSGQYVRAVVSGWTVPEVAPNWPLRSTLQTRAEQEGADALHARLASLDPLAASRIDARNVRRVIRALEVCLETGQPISRLQQRRPPDYPILQIGLRRSQAGLYSGIDRRIEQMLARGWADEVRTLLARGLCPELPAMSALGYPEMVRHVRGELTLDETSTLIKRHTRRFVRQQRNWFRANDPQINWFDAEADPTPAIRTLITGWLAI